MNKRINTSEIMGMSFLLVLILCSVGEPYSYTVSCTVPEGQQEYLYIDAVTSNNNFNPSENIVISTNLEDRTITLAASNFYFQIMMLSQCVNGSHRINYPTGSSHDFISFNSVTTMNSQKDINWLYGLSGIVCGCLFWYGILKNF